MCSVQSHYMHFQKYIHSHFTLRKVEWKFQGEGGSWNVTFQRSVGFKPKPFLGEWAGRGLLFSGTTRYAVSKQIVMRVSLSNYMVTINILYYILNQNNQWTVSFDRAMQPLACTLEYPLCLIDPLALALCREQRPLMSLHGQNPDWSLA